MMRRNFFPGHDLAQVVSAQNAAVHAPPPVYVPSFRSQDANPIFFPNLALTTHMGKTVRFYEDLIHGKTVLLNFIRAASIDGVCPPAAAILRRVQERLGERMGRDIFFSSITLDPQRDTPEVLHAYAARIDVKPGWTLLTGKRVDIEILRRRLGYVDADPPRDQDPENHVAVARYGDDRSQRWNSISLRNSPAKIARALAQIAA
jgi:protein SCO1/2